MEIKSLLTYDDVTLSIDSKVLLEKVHLSFHTNCLNVIVGGSGAGKSTLLKSLLGLYSIEKGQIRFAGQELKGETLSKFRSKIVYIGQRPYLGEGTVWESMIMPLSYKCNQHLTVNPEAAHDYCRELNLNPSILQQKVSECSEGEQKRLALMRGLLLQKEIFLLDEISSGLDQDNQKVVMKLIKSKNITSIAVTHDAYWQEEAHHTFRVQNKGVEVVK